MPMRRKITAYTLPMLFFVALLASAGILRKIDNHVWLSAPEFWIYPAQTILGGALLIWFRREYDFGRPRGFIFATLIGLCVFALWISPQAFFGFPPRTIGFNPDTFGDHSVYWAQVVLRFVRLIIVAPFVEEIFWRGFLLRYFVNEKFDRVPFGSFSWLSFSIVTIGFALSHSAADWISALIAGTLYNCVAYRTKSLLSCIFAHSLTNLLLGLWIMKTKQWGFW
jgi:CAAX prenyl protease-like protein